MKFECVKKNIILEKNQLSNFSKITFKKEMIRDSLKNMYKEYKQKMRSMYVIEPSCYEIFASIAEKSQYIPYRDSALTWLLKDSIGGNASTSIIISKRSCSFYSDEIQMP